MQMPKSKFPNDFTFCKTQRRASDLDFFIILRTTALLLALMLMQIPSFAWSVPSLSPALQARCARAPQIIVQAQSTQATIVQNQPRGPKSALKAGWKIQGLTKFDRDTYVTFEWEKQRDRSGTCVRIKKMEIAIGNMSPQVWLAPAVKRNACLKNVVLEHELKHVAHHKAFSDQLKHGLNRKLRYMIRGKTYRAITGSTSESNAKKELERVGKLAVLKIQKPIENAARQKDQSIDTSQNYAKELAKCGL